MDKAVEWYLWSAEEIIEALPELISEVESHLDDFPEEHRQKNQSAVEALRTSPPTAAQIREATRSRDLVTLGFALDVLGRRAARDSEVHRSLAMFQAAHEMFRAGNPLLRPTKPMRQTLGNALRLLTLSEVDRIRSGATVADALRKTLRDLVTSAWGAVPPQLALSLDELLLGELERVRAEGERDAAFHERLVRDNLEAILALEIPTRLERVRTRWQELGAEMVPGAGSVGWRAIRRAEPLSTLLPAATWSAIQQAVERGDPGALGHTLAEVEEDLEANLRLRLDARTEYREPASELRVSGGTDPAFVEARGLLLRRDSAALSHFNDIHYRRSANTIAKEWYAYALALFGRPTDIHDIIELLEAAIVSERFRPDRGWTARWNLACALRRLPSRAVEALDALIPVLDLDAHPAEAFQLCLLWALEQDRRDALATLFLKAHHYESHLLAALQDAEVLVERGGGTGFREHFRRINRILRDPDRVFPDPKERLTFDELDQLTRDFTESSMIAAGVEWFRQRLSYGNERHVFKNWECAAVLHEEAGDPPAAWRCRTQSWRATQHKKNVDPRKKTHVLRSLLGWAQRTGFNEEALRLLRQSWRETSMSDADARVWEQRLGAVSSREEPEFPLGGGSDPDLVPHATARVESDRAGARPNAPRAAPLVRWPGHGPTGAAGVRSSQSLALMLDWENVKLSLAEVLAEFPDSGRAETLRPRLGAPELASRLLDAASRYGWPRQRWAVADWDRPSFEGDQKAVKNAGYWPDIAGAGKFNASDHVLREKIHFVLREHPEIDVYVIATGDGDFHEAIRTLQQHGKQVILWSTRRTVNEVYGESLRGLNRIQIEWLEDLVFGQGVTA